MTKKQIHMFGFTCLALILTTSPAISGEPTYKQNSTASQTSAREAYIDENTGELISPPPSDTSLQQGNNTALKTKEQEIEYTTHPDGMIEGKLDGQFESQLMATMDCNGNVKQEHSDGDSLSAPKSAQLDNCASK